MREMTWRAKSGKTLDYGITFRALAALFREAQSEWAGYAYQFQVTMLEVYNDKVRRCRLTLSNPT
jgi:hypothetical protein